MDASAVVDILRRAVPAASVEALPSTDMPTVVVDRDHLIDVCRTLRDDPTLQFALLVDATAVDFFPAEPRYEMVYHLACVGNRLTLKVDGRLAAEVIDNDPTQADAAGILALQLHSGPPTVAEFKDIRLKVLKRSVPARQ